ncbi:hypothetical protein C8R44DRAFT_866094 [Mycena epipterygia]|nr:hypothetical protein C8R44DRAFT_866094 [Mycena epipterygia]
MSTPPSTVRAVQPPDNYISRIPQDVLSIILGDIISPYLLWHWLTLPSIRFDLCTVCVHFEPAVAGRVANWTTICVHRFSPPTYITHCVTLARGAPVYLYCDAEVPDQLPHIKRPTPLPCRTYLDWAADVLPILKDIAPQVHTLRVICEGDVSWPPIASQLYTFAWDALRHMAVANHRPLPEPQSPADTLPFTPLVSTMSLFCILPQLNASDVAYSNVTNLSIGHINARMNVSWGTLAAVLRAATNVAVLVLHSVDCGERAFEGPITMSNLERLEFVYSKGSSCAILSTLDAPKLTAARISVHGRTFAGLELRCPSLLSRLSHVVLHIGDTSLQSLPDILRCLSSARILALNVSFEQYEELVEALTMIPLVRLQLLYLMSSGSIHLRTTAVAELLRQLGPECRFLTAPTEPGAEVVQWNLVDNVVRQCQLPRAQFSPSSLLLTT